MKMIIKKSNKSGKKYMAIFKKDTTRAGYLSYYILWGESKSIRQNINSYKRRFNL